MKLYKIVNYGYHVQQFYVRKGKYLICTSGLYARLDSHPAPHRLQNIRMLLSSTKFRTYTFLFADDSAYCIRFDWFKQIWYQFNIDFIYSSSKPLELFDSVRRPVKRLLYSTYYYIVKVLASQAFSVSTCYACLYEIALHALIHCALGSGRNDR